METKENKIKYFIYCRKSSEDEDRQILSIESQKRELLVYVKKEKLKVIDIIEEEKSAHHLGREKFNKLIERIEKKEANGLLVWQANRISRNPVDSGKIIYFMDIGNLVEVKTPSRTFYATPDDKFMLSLEFGMSKKDSDEKSINVKRGLRTKLTMGWRPGVAKIGYLNDKTKDYGERDIIPDPERFDIVRRIWDTMLTGKYSVRQIMKLGNDEWGLRTRKTKRQGGKPLTLSHYYDILTDAFYYGSFWWKDENGEKKLFKGSHKPMIKEDEFNRVQILLGRKGKPQPKTHQFSFTGLMRCGECGSMITAEEKYQLICPNCKFKFAYLNKTNCPKCNVKIEDMKNPTMLHYIYYHCTKKKSPNCTQGSIRLKDLENQIDKTLKHIQISEKFKDWAIEKLQRETKQELKVQKQIDRSVAEEREKLKQGLADLNRFIIKQENAGWTLMSKEEALVEKERLVKDLNKIEEKQIDNNQRAENWFELSVKTFEFACFARFWFQNGTLEQKRTVLSALGSNLTLKDKNLCVLIQKPLSFIEEMVKTFPAISLGFEPEKIGLNKAKTASQAAKTTSLLSVLNKIRTFFRENPDADF